MNFNKAIILGNVTRDPENRMMPTGGQVTSFSVATNRYYTQNGEKKTEAEFHNVVCFGKLAEISSQYLKKGALVMIEGRIKTRNWMNQQGQKQYRTEIVAETMQLGPRGAGGMGGGQSSGSSSGYQKPAADEQPLSDEIPVIEENYAPPASLNNDNGEINVNDIPF